MFEAINRHVSRLADLNQRELQRFNELLIPKEVARRSILLRPGEICRFEAYVVRGLLRSYMPDPSGQAVILTFAAEDWWISDIRSFCEGSPSGMFIDALEDAELLLLSPQHKETLLREVPAMEKVFRLLLQRHLSGLQQRFFDQLSVPAAERYLNFMHKYPALLQRIPQRQIASYLGIAPESLSRLRRQLAGRT